MSIPPIKTRHLREFRVTSNTINKRYLAGSPLILDCRSTVVDVASLVTSSNSLYSNPEKPVTLAKRKVKNPMWTSPKKQSFDLKSTLARFKDYETSSLTIHEPIYFSHPPPEPYQQTLPAFEILKKYEEYAELGKINQHAKAFVKAVDLSMRRSGRTKKVIQMNTLDSIDRYGNRIDFRVQKLLGS